MTKRPTVWLVSALLLTAVAATVRPPLVRAASRQELERDAAAALKSLYAHNNAARLLGERSRAVLVFPHIENKIDAVIRYDLAATIPVVEEESGEPAK